MCQHLLKKMKKIIVAILIVLIISGGAIYWYLNQEKITPEKVLQEYVSKIATDDYEEMYEMLDEESKERVSKDIFIARNKNIYSGIDMSGMKIEIKEIESPSSQKRNIKYQTTMDVSGREISFENNVILNKNQNNEYKISWHSNLIFPNLGDNDKVKVNTLEASRGIITDRNGKELVTNGKASSVGIVPGKLGENKKESINKIADLLEITGDAIESKLSASWVKDDSFIPIKTIKIDETETKEKLLQIPGVKITSVSARTYPLGEAAAQLTGYVQTIAKEELEKNTGYSSNSLIGKTGAEKLFESRLKGKNGVEIYIVDENGNKKETILNQEKIDGENIKLTIDSNIQKNLYNELKEDSGLFVVMNKDTGELLALVSTPSYDVNKMTLGMSTSEWNEISNNSNSPMMSKYLQSYCPGSTFKPITGAIGLDSGTLTSEDTFEYSGLSWQKDKTWGNFNITTLTAYSGAKNLRNALIHSDNIYFAQATLKIGKTNFIEGLKKLKFNENLDIEVNVSKSQYSNSDTISSEGALADSGYGQGEILVNPIHMASIYSAFVNSGNMLKPYVEYKEDKTPQYLVENAFSEDAANTIKEDLIQVVENPEGTAKDMKINGITIAGKTGTAELKASREETADTLGWFDCIALDDTANPYIVVGMVEKGNVNGGSHHIIPMIRKLFVK